MENMTHVPDEFAAFSLRIHKWVPVSCFQNSPHMWSIGHDHVVFL
jgi:hypothetical protein